MKKLYNMTLLFALVTLSNSCTKTQTVSESPLSEYDMWVKEAKENLPEGKEKEKILDNCIACHSYEMFSQNRLSRKEWDETITWMQEIVSSHSFRDKRFCEKNGMKQLLGCKKSKIFGSLKKSTENKYLII